MSEQEMKELADFYKVDWSVFTDGPRKNFDATYFCFVSYTRKVLALIPFLSIVFGGQYDEFPMDSEEQNVRLCYEDYSLEKFSFQP